MIEKLKNFGEAAKNVIIFILTPVILIGLTIYMLLTKNAALKDELKAKDGTEKLKELEGEQKQIDTSANDAVSEYDKLREAYLRPGADGVQQSGGSSKAADPDKGSGPKSG